MSQPHDVQITNSLQAQRLRGAVRLGHYFAFIDDERALVSVQGRAPSGRGRLSRLLVQPEPARSLGRVRPLIDQPLELPGVRIVPRARSIDPVACVVADRDLYRAEEDSVRLFLAMPRPADDVGLVVTCNGEPFTERAVSLADGMTIETLSALLPGRYGARLTCRGRPIGQPVEFTVAAYTLAPLSGRLLAHELDRAAGALSFALDVESYQVPFAGALQVALVDAGREVARQTLRPASPGRYRGGVALRGDGPFRLRLQAAGDAERVAEVVIPGSRSHERALTVVSELGQEMLFSLMPEPGALPARGGYLSAGDHLATPLTVAGVVAERGVIQARADVDDLVLVTLDLTTGSFAVQAHGSARAGDEIEVETGAPVATVLAGCFAGGRPFEGYTSVFRPSRLWLDVSVPERARPREDLVVDLRCAGADQVPVLLCVRDQRLTATDTPDKGLGAAAKAGIEAATRDMADAGLVPLEDLLEDMIVFHPGAMAGGLRTVTGMAMPAARSRAAEGAAPPPAAAMPADDTLRMRLNRAVDLDFEEDPRGAVDTFAEVPTGQGMPRAMPGRGAAPGSSPAEAPAPRAVFPEVLFYGVVPVREREQVRIPLGDTLSSFAVEAFALAGGDWTEARAGVVVDQPVRVDIEAPPAVQPGDVVRGRVRAHAASGKARVRLARDGHTVALRRADGQAVVADAVLDTPVELAFDVAPGLHLAEVTDARSGDTDAMELLVEPPGRFKHQSRELGLLQRGDAITLDSAGALSLRLLPGVDQPLDSLVTATAGYAHLCCEQTAAKILASVLMYLTAGDPARRQKAEEIILAGIARERTMLRPGRGFAMYPDYDMISDHYSRLAVRYLWSLSRLEDVLDLPGALARAAREGMQLADTAAQAHDMARVPARIACMEDAYAAASAGADAGGVRAYIDQAVDFTGREVRIRAPRHAVADRARLAYAAASLIALGDLGRGLRAADQVTRQLNQQGALYSTVDSVAAIALVIQMRVAGVVGSGRVRVNGRDMSTAEAMALGDQVESVEVLDGVAAVEVSRIVEEDWDAFAAGVPVKVGFRDARDKRVKRFEMGDRVDLVVTLPGGYQAGDLLHVSLPGCMAWIQGGGKVKRFTMDFAGRSELRVPVVVTSAIDGKQHFAVCVRNMFEEERAGSPGLIAVSGGRRWP